MTFEEAKAKFPCEETKGVTYRDDLTHEVSHYYDIENNYYDVKINRESFDKNEDHGEEVTVKRGTCTEITFIQS